MMRLMTVLLALTALVCVGCKGGKDEQKENPAIKKAEDEALHKLDMMAKGSAHYFMAPHVTSEGRKLAPQFVRSNDWTPKGKACDHKDKRFPYDSSQWATIEWSALTFQMNDPHYAQYKVQSSGTMAKATTTLSARVDPDCDGKFTEFSVTLTADPKTTLAQGNAVIGKIQKQ